MTVPLLTTRHRLESRQEMGVLLRLGGEAVVVPVRPVFRRLLLGICLSVLPCERSKLGFAR